MTEQFSSDRVIVTGSNGYIGASLVRELKSSNIEFLGLSRFKVPSSKSIHSEKPPTVVPSHWFDSISQFKPTKLVLCDWQGVTAQKRDERDQYENILRWSSITQRALECGVEKIVALGSQAELSSIQDGVTESEVPKPRSEYGFAKMEAYEKLKAIIESYSKEFVWARIFSIYGDNMSRDLFLTKIIRAINNQEKLSTTSLTQIWNYLHEDDCARALLFLLGSGISGTYHVASRRSLPLIDLVRLVAMYLGKPVSLDIGSVPFRRDDTLVMRPNIDKLSTLGWKELIPLESGIKQLVNVISGEKVVN